MQREVAERVVSCLDRQDLRALAGNGIGALCVILSATKPWSRVTDLPGQHAVARRLERLGWLAIWEEHPQCFQATLSGEAIEKLQVDIDEIPCRHAGVIDCWVTLKSLEKQAETPRSSGLSQWPIPGIPEEEPTMIDVETGPTTPPDPEDVELIKTKTFDVELVKAAFRIPPYAVDGPAIAAYHSRQSSRILMGAFVGAIKPKPRSSKPTKPKR